MGESAAGSVIFAEVPRIIGTWTFSARSAILQETLVQLWRAYPRYDPAFLFTTWMYRIALNSAISWRRRERTQTQHLHPEGENLLAGVAAADSEHHSMISLTSFHDLPDIIQGSPGLRSMISLTSFNDLPNIIQ